MGAEQVATGAGLGATLGGVGAVAGGLGGLVSSLFGSDGPATLTPEAQYELSRMGIDVQKFMANLQSVASTYQMQMESGGYGAYDKIYGQGENNAADYINSAFSGELTPGAQKGITDLGQQLGNQSNLSEQDIINQSVQFGRPVDSPDVQAQLAKAKTGVRSAFGAVKGTIMSQDYANSTGLASQLLNQARTGRISGVNVATPGVDTPEQAAARKAIEDKKTQIANMQKGTGSTSKFGGLFGMLSSLPGQAGSAFSNINQKTGGADYTRANQELASMQSAFDKTYGSGATASTNGAPQMAGSYGFGGSGNYQNTYFNNNAIADAKSNQSETDKGLEFWKNGGFYNNNNKAFG
jgi:hypothetical protein